MRSLTSTNSRPYRHFGGVALHNRAPHHAKHFAVLPQNAEFEREILRERVKAGIVQARARGQPHGRPPIVKARSAEIKRLFARGLSKREIAKRLKVGRTSVRRVLTQKGLRP